MKNIYYICTKTLKNDNGIIQFTKGKKYKIESEGFSQLIFMNDEHKPHIVIFTTNSHWARYFVKQEINKILNDL